MEAQNIEEIRALIKELAEKVGFYATVEAEKNEFSTEDEDVIFNVNVDSDSHILIGQFGANLQAFQHIARLIARKKIHERVNFVLDVNSYRQEKNQSIMETAKLAAEQAASEKRAVVMKPMSAYERMLVHMELSKNPSVTTESIGEGEGRKVVVKPSGSFM